MDLNSVSASSTEPPCIIKISTVPKDSPCGVVSSVKFLFDVSRNILARQEKREVSKRFYAAQGADICSTNLLDVVLGKRLGCNIHSILLHLIFHVGVFNDGFSLVTHDCNCSRVDGNGVGKQTSKTKKVGIEQTRWLCGVSVPADLASSLAKLRLSILLGGLVGLNDQIFRAGLDSRESTHWI